jgi:undecaprenyl phosphate-alpha-L-ara4N flippase subunit ArnE
MDLSAFLIILAAVALEVFGQLSFKRGASTVALAADRKGLLAYCSGILGNTWILVGIGAYAFEIVVGLAALCLAPLSVVFPLLSLSYCGVAAGSHLLLGERLGVHGIIAICLITLGAVLVSWPNA